MVAKNQSLTNYLDDFLVFAFMKAECDRMLKIFWAICWQIGCPVSIEKMEWSSSMMIFLGLLLDGKHLVISLPIDKCQRALLLLTYAINKKKVTIKFIQTLTGMPNFLSRAIVPGQTFTRMMYHKLKGK